MDMRTEMRLASQHSNGSQDGIATAPALKRADAEIRAFVEVFEPSPSTPSAPLQDGALHGLTFGVKEVFEQRGQKSPWGVDFLYDRTGPVTASCVSKLEELGACRRGTTRSTLMAIAGESETRNPRDLSRSPGGSSAGSAAAVAANFVDFALGTQTVGSIIRPASYCGVTGFKPTFGRIATDGTMPLAQELDHVGLLASSVATIKAVVQGLTGDAPPSVRFDTVLVPRIWFDEPVDPAVHAALETACRDLQNLGLSTEDFEVPQDVIASEEEVLNGLLCKGIHDNHGDFVQENRGRLPAELVELESRGQRVTADGHSALRARQQELSARMSEAVPSGAVLLCPAVCDVPPRLGGGTGSRTPQRLWTLLGWPALGIPHGRYAHQMRHLSVSIQLVAPTMQDTALLDLGETLQSRSTVGATAVPRSGSAQQV